MRYMIALLFMGSFLTTTAIGADNQDQAGELEATMALIANWLGGVYDNSAQVTADEVNNVPQDERHMPIHQIVVPVTIDGFDGLMFFQQLSNDGTVETILQVHLYQYRVHPESGTVTRRLHLFNDEERFVNAHLDISKLDGLTLDDVHSPEGCDYYYSLSEDGSQIQGLMKAEPGCFPIHPETGEKIHHIDELIIRPGEIWNNATYYDLEGNLLYGNLSGEYQKMVLIAD
jgi:hypothetical protein